MISFREYLKRKLQPLVEGGNAYALDRKTGVQMPGSEAQKMILTGDNKNADRATLQEDFKQLLIDLNSKMDIWENLESILKKNPGALFNGSSELFFNNNITNFEEHKPSMGDFDLLVPNTKRKDVFNGLLELENQQIGKFKYIGNNKKQVTDKTDQINAVFNYNGKVNIQIDFEFVPFNKGLPTEFAKFGKNSSWTDLSNRKVIDIKPTTFPKKSLEDIKQKVNEYLENNWSKFVDGIIRKVKKEVPEEKQNDILLKLKNESMMAQVKQDVEKEEDRIATIINKDFAELTKKPLGKKQVAIKSLFHKFLLMSLTKAQTKLPPNPTVLMPKSDKVSSNKAYQDISSHSFSILYGLRPKFKEVPKTPEEKTALGVQPATKLYREISTEDAKANKLYINNIEGIFNTLFPELKGQYAQYAKDFNSATGIIGLIKTTKKDPKIISRMLKGIIDKMYNKEVAMGAQRLSKEATGLEDFEIKEAFLVFLREAFPQQMSALETDIQNLKATYYSEYWEDQIKYYVSRAAKAHISKSVGMDTEEEDEDVTE